MTAPDARYLKPLTHWLIYRGYRARFATRSPQQVTGQLTTADGQQVGFTYAPETRIVQLPGVRIQINEYGWELAREELGTS